MGQHIKFWATNEDLRNLERLRAKWPRWGTAQLLHKALAIAALVLDENDEYRADAVQSGPPQEVRELSPFEQAVQELFEAQD